MSFTNMKRDELYELAVNNFGVEVSETATKPQIIGALNEWGVTWEMAKALDENAAAVEEEVVEAKADALAVGTVPTGVITAASVNPAAESVVALEPTEVNFIEVPKGVDGYVRNNVFYPEEIVVSEPEPKVFVPTGHSAVTNLGRVLLKMERENPRYEVRGHRFTQENPFALVAETDADYILSNVEGFKVASPREAKEFYG